MNHFPVNCDINKVSFILYETVFVGLRFNSLHSKQVNMAYIPTSLRYIPNPGVKNFHKERKFTDDINKLIYKKHIENHWNEEVAKSLAWDFKQ